MSSEDGRTGKTMNRKNSTTSSKEHLTYGVLSSSAVVSTIEGSPNSSPANDRENVGISKTVEFRVYEMRDSV
jgi:hypothetical protein